MKRKKLRNCLFFFSLPPFGCCFRNGCSLPMFHHSLQRKSVTKIDLTSLYTLVNFFVRILFIAIFRACEHDVPFALEIYSNGRIKQAYGILSFHPQKYIPTTGMPTATKLGRAVTYRKEIPPKKSRDPLIPWSYEIAWQIKNISPLPQCPWPPNLTGWSRTLRGSYPLSQMTLQSCGLVRSHDKLRTYLHYLNAYSHQTWQGVDIKDGDLPWGASSLKAITLEVRDHVRSHDKLKALNLHYHNASGNQLCQGGYILLGAPLPLIELHDIMWSCEVTWHFKSIAEDLWTPD